MYESIVSGEGEILKVMMFFNLSRGSVQFCC